MLTKFKELSLLKKALVILGAFVLLGAIVSAFSDDEEATEETTTTTTEAEEVTEPEPETTEATEAPETTEAPTTTEAAEEGTRDNPTPLGADHSFVVDTYGDGDGSSWTLKVDGPGSDITAAVLAENQFNEPPVAGNVFYGVPITLTLNLAQKEPLSTGWNISPEFYGPDSKNVYGGLSDWGCGVTPNEFDEYTEVFAGGSVSGIVCYSVTAEDAAAGVLITLDEIQGDRIFLATQ